MKKVIAKMKGRSSIGVRSSNRDNTVALSLRVSQIDDFPIHLTNCLTYQLEGRIYAYLGDDG